MKKVILFAMLLIVIIIAAWWTLKYLGYFTGDTVPGGNRQQLGI